MSDTDFNKLSNITQPLVLSELTNKDGFRFELDVAEQNSAMYADNAYIDLDDENDDDEPLDIAELGSPWTRPFDELRKMMDPINDNMHKRIIRHGNMESGLVPKNARVALRYSAYWEGEDAPFDSSVLRCKKFEFVTGKGEVLEGLDAAVSTMCPFEVAEFIISYKLLFKELGCMPRVKPKADALFKVEILNFTLVGDANALNDVSSEDSRKFAVILPKVKDIQLQGKDCANRGSFNSATNAFEQALAALHYCHLADEQEEQERTKLLLTIYTNLMICYNKLNKSQRVCKIMEAINNLTNNQPSSKALFQAGRALAELGEYKRARELFIKAKTLQPLNKAITAEILKLEERMNHYDKISRDIWSRALGTANKKPNTIDNEKNNEFEKVKQGFETYIEDFLKSPVKCLSFSKQLYTAKQFKVLCQVAKEKNVKFNVSQMNDGTVTLYKNSNQ